MAATASILPARQLAMFNSIFSDIGPPKTKQPHDEATVSRLTNKLVEQVKVDAHNVLGVHNEQYIYRGTGFKPHFATCPSMSATTVPTQQQRAVLLNLMSKTASIAQSSTWTTRLGSAGVKKVFARMINAAISEFVSWSYGGVYNDEIQSHLRFWVEHVLATYIKLFLYTCDIGINRVEKAPRPTEAEIEKWHAMALRRLHALRVDELFDMVVDWPNTTPGVDDLRPLLSTPQSRQYVIERFSRSLQTRLLHPGASTVEILQIYVNIIRAFKRLDARGVLLGRVSARLRQYLKERDDTVKVVVAGLLSDISAAPEEHTSDQDNPEVLSELAWELQHRDPAANKFSSGLDWNNMDWVPDAIDAAPDTATGRGAKQSDVIGSVISLFESKDFFVKELQSALAERLLRNKDDYDQETSVLEHLKIRFGDAALQACEVMLRDVLDSRRLDAVIRRDQGLNVLNTKQGKEDEGEPEVHAKILSRLFWPALPGLTGTTMGGGMTFGHDDTEEGESFAPPIAIAHQRHLYEKGFEALKQTRKLSWNDNLGQVEIEITFADGRTYTDEVLPYQAGVIYAFQEDDNEDEATTKSTTKPTKKKPISKTITSLSKDLHLSPSLTRSACLLFVSKKVLTTHPSTPDTFTVLEYLPTTVLIDPTTTHPTSPSTNPTLTFSPTHPNLSSIDAPAAAAQAASERAAELAALNAQKEAEAREKKAKLAVYQQYITAMLVNGGAMPLARISMMLGVVVPGGFPFSSEELREFLAGMVREGEVEVVGGNYKKKG